MDHTPRMVRLDPKRSDPRILLRAASIIRHAGVVAHPTETFYGLAADPFSEEAVARVRAVKGREAGQPMLLLLPHTEAVHDLARIGGAAAVWFAALTRAFWPGPLTLVVPARDGLRCPALGGGGTVAVRLSPHPVAWQLARMAGAPITSTSANPSGAPAPASAQAIDPAVASAVDLVLDGGPTPGERPSTLLDLTAQTPRVVRAGAIPAGALARVLGFAPRVEDPSGVTRPAGGGAPDGRPGDSHLQ
jgi:L-threonylcarbamoyladenylate synthase